MALAVLLLSLALSFIFLVYVRTYCSNPRVTGVVGRGQVLIVTRDSTHTIDVSFDLFHICV